MRAHDTYGKRSTTWPVVCLLFTLVSLSAASWAQTTEADARKAIQAQLDQSAKALADKDVDAYSKNWTSDYKVTGIFGETLDRERAASGLRDALANVSNVKATMTIDRLKVNGDTATVLIRRKGTADVTSPDGKALPFSRDEREVQTWTKTPDGWKQKAATVLTQKDTIDAKPWTPESKADDAPIREAIQARYDAIARTLVAGDKDALAREFPVEFVFIDPTTGNAQKRDDFLADMQKSLAAPPARFKPTLERALIDGDKAIVITTVEMDANVKGSGGNQHIVQAMTQRDIWKKTGSGWTLVETRPLLSEWSRDGKQQPTRFAGGGAD